MSKLTEIQVSLLTTAAQRSNGSVYPLPESIAGRAIRIGRTITSLMKHGFVSEAVVDDSSLAWRDKDGVRYGAFITAVGRQTVGNEAPKASQPKVPGAASAKPATKAQLILDLLSRGDGATLDELTGATGWLPHTARAALTGLRKKGHVIEKSKRADVTCYRIRQAA